MKFAVEGEINLGRETRKFLKQIEAPNERVAKEHTLSVMGSVHGKKRTQIKISSVKKVG